MRKAHDIQVKEKAGIVYRKHKGCSSCVVEYLFKLSPALAQKCLPPLISLASVPIHMPQDSGIPVSPLWSLIATESNGNTLGVHLPQS